MANLIPPQAKKNIIVEYWVRVATVWLGLLGVAALTLAILNVPLFVLIKNQLGAYTHLYENASEQNSSFESIEAEIASANETAALLATAKNVKPLLPYIDIINSLSSDQVRITSFQLVRVGTVLEAVEIAGKAENRGALVAFSRALEATEEIETADIPLSNLAKDSDIPFTISAIVTKAP